MEELYLAGALVRGLGSENIDYRLRNAQFAKPEGVRWLGTSIASLSQLQRVLVIGSNLRKDHPLFAMRVRAAVRKGAAVSVIHDVAQRLGHVRSRPRRSRRPANWVQALADVAAAVAPRRTVAAPVQGNATDAAKAIAQSLLGGERKAILLGNAAAHHANASSLLALANWIGAQTGATVGYLTEAANTVGAQLVGALPGANGLNAGQMLGRLAEGRDPAEQRAGVRFRCRPQGRRRAGQGRNGRDPEPVQGQPGIQRRAAADRAVHRNARHLCQRRRPRAELPCRGQDRWAKPGRPGR